MRHAMSSNGPNGERQRPAIELPTFHTERLILRGVRKSDIPAYERHFVDYEVVRFLAKGVPWPYPAGGIADYVKTKLLPAQGKNQWIWAITLKESPDELIGVVHLLRDATPANRGFWLGRKFWGNGYMTEAVTPVMDYAFQNLGFEKLIFANAAGNSRSSRVKEKTGATFLRREPDEFVDPAFTERELYELTKEAWEKFKLEKSRI